MQYDVAIVGGGMAGLTSAAYLAQSGYKVVLCEQQPKVGGLVNSFEYKGFVLDGGIRAIENSGIVFPMLRQLGIDVPFYKNDVSLRIGGETLPLKKESFLSDYPAFMSRLFPNDAPAIQKLTREISKSMQHMKVLYGFDNPLFVDLKENLPYALSLLPWMVKYLFTIGKIDGLSEPIDEYMAHFISNPALIDMFAQHFFFKTPAFFALSYFSLYLDYNYPAGGTGALVQKMEQYLTEKKVELRTNCCISAVNCTANQLTDTEGNTLSYKKIIWAADTKQLYRSLDYTNIQNPSLREKLVSTRQNLEPKTGSDSILTVYLLLATPADRLSHSIGPHLFYTPQLLGLSNQQLLAKKQRAFQDEKIIGSKQDVLDWVRQYLQANTFEISCPALRDPQLAPEGHSALIVSCLLEYWVVEQIKQQGYYDEFKQYCEEEIKQIILATLLPEHQHSFIESFSSTPLTIHQYTANTDGSVTGWSFKNSPVPSVTKMSQVAATIKTDVPNMYQAGQWTFAPSGLPIAVLTGKLAADKIKQNLGAPSL